MEEFLITLLKSGGTAFLGSRIAKALGQNEISEIIAASGWTIVGIKGIETLMPLVNFIKRTVDVLDKIGDKLNLK